MSQRLNPTIPKSYKYAEDPVGFITQVLGDHVWSKQIEILEALVKHRLVAVQSAHGIGKSFTASRAIAWWIETRPRAFAVSTAPTESQVKSILWREINRVHKSGSLSGRTNQKEWWIDKEIVAMGRKPSDYDSAAFQGIHELHVLGVLDEADGVPESLFRAMGTLTTNRYGRLLAIGNPDDPTSYFCSKVLADDSAWHKIQVSAFDSPNFTGEEVPDEVRDLLVGSEWVEEKKQEYGERSGVYMSKVLGQIPTNAADGVIPIAWIKRAIIDKEDGVADGLLEPCELGVDVGAGGDDTNVRERRGVRILRSWSDKTPDPADARALVLNAFEQTRIDGHPARKIKVDANGVGWALAGMIRDVLPKVEVQSIMVQHRALNPVRFTQLRDQIWFDVGRELFKDNVIDMSQAMYPERLTAELTAPKYTIRNGRHKVESKVEIRKRIGRSTDDADATLLSFVDLPEPPPDNEMFEYYDPVEIGPSV